MQYGRWLNLAPEPLESRTLLSAAPVNVNISRAPANQAEGAITVDPTTPTRLFALSNTEQEDAGLVAARSNDGGQTWATGVIADGTHDALPAACCDPSASFDAYGNLFVSYISVKDDEVEVLLSSDGGKHFSLLTQFSGDVDQPTITSGAGSVWVTFTKGNRVVASGASVTGPGQVGDFGPLQKARGSVSGSFGDIAIGPDGQVTTTYQKNLGGGKFMIGINTDPDGLGPAGFGKQINAAPTNVGLFEYIPAQSTRGVDAEAGLAYDQSSGPHRGRLYLVYNDAAPRGVNLDIFLRYSDDNGSHWSSPMRVNDDTGLSDQFLPRISFDNTTGNVVMSWYDTRDDVGTGVPDSNDPGATPNAANDDSALYAAIAVPTDGGMNISRNVRISAGLSNADSAKSGIDLGDYTGLAAANGVFHPIWADNSNSTRNNPDGAHKALDQYTAAVNESDVPAPDRLALGGTDLSNGQATATLAVRDYSAVRSGSSFAFKVVYSANSAIDAAQFNGTELEVNGPNGFTQSPQLHRLKRSQDGHSITANYVLHNPAGRLRPVQNGVYQILTTPAIANLGGGTIAADAALGSFVVLV